MKFFRAADGKQYPMSQIRRIGDRREITFVSNRKDGSRHERKGEVVEIGMLDDRTVDVERYEYDSWDYIPVTSFAAAPGTVILYPDDGEEGFFKVPVLGWAVCSDESVVPVTVDGVNDGSPGERVVLLPTGEVISFNSTYDSVKSWLESRSGD